MSSIVHLKSPSEAFFHPVNIGKRNFVPVSFKMSASLGKAVCYVFLLNFAIYSATDNPRLQDVLLALKKMVSYYKETHRDMNLDGIYGLRVLEGKQKFEVYFSNEGSYKDCTYY